MKKKKIYEGKILGLSVYEGKIEGRKVKREMIEHRGAAAMLAFDEKNKVILVKQHRFPHGYVLEIPAGTLEKREAPIKCAFTKPDRLLAIEAISLHKKYEEKLGKLRTTLGNKKQIPIEFLDLVYMFEKIAQSWADVADLVQPIYNE